MDKSTSMWSAASSAAAADLPGRLGSGSSLGVSPMAEHPGGLKPGAGHIGAGHAAAMESNRATVRLFAAIAILACILAMALSPASAYAMEVSSCTAKPNAESGNDIMGATNTRINWEGQAADDEIVTALSFTLPDGTDYSLDDLKVTMLSGDDLMTRTNLDVEATSDGQTVTIAINDELPAGAYIRVEIYDVYFPRDGGDMQIEGTYTLDDGQVLSIEGIPTITVEGITVAEQLSQWLEEQEWVQAWNSVRALHMFLDPTLIVTSFPVVFKGFLMALGIVACAFPLAIPFGFLLSLMRMSKFTALRGIASVYVNLVRGTPLFLQIYVAFFGLPLAGIQIPNFPLGVIVLSMNSCAYMCEIFRAGIQSIPAGQFEAARSLGMTGAQTMLSVIIPQTVRRVIPTLTSEFILLYKDTSMLAAVGLLEIVMYAKTIVASTGSITPYIVAACFYLVITLPLAWLVGKLENKLAGTDSGSSRPKEKKSKKGSKAADVAGASGETAPAATMAVAKRSAMTVAAGIMGNFGKAVAKLAGSAVHGAMALARNVVAICKAAVARVCEAVEDCKAAANGRAGSPSSVRWAEGPSAWDAGAELELEAAEDQPDVSGAGPGVADSCGSSAGHIVRSCPIHIRQHAVPSGASASGLVSSRPWCPSPLSASSGGPTVLQRHEAKAIEKTAKRADRRPR